MESTVKNGTAGSFPMAPAESSSRTNYAYYTSKAAQADYANLLANLGASLSGQSDAWDHTVKHLAMLERRSPDDEEPVNSDSVEMAVVVANALRSNGGVAPLSSVDADGDVLLHWERNNYRGTVVVTGETVALLITEGRRVAYVGPKQPANINTVNSILLLIGESAAEWKPMQGRSSSGTLTISNRCAGKSFGHSWSNLSSEWGLDGPSLALFDSQKDQTEGDAILCSGWK